MSDWANIIPLVLLVLAFWLLVLRPARARQRAFQQTQSEVAVGARVMLASGIFGEVAAVADETVELTIAPGVVVTVARQAIARVDTPHSEAEPEPGTDD